MTVSTKEIALAATAVRRMPTHYNFTGLSDTQLYDAERALLTVALTGAPTEFLVEHLQAIRDQLKASHKQCNASPVREIDIRNNTPFKVSVSASADPDGTINVAITPRAA